MHRSAPASIAVAAAIAVLLGGCAEAAVPEGFASFGPPGATPTTSPPSTGPVEPTTPPASASPTAPASATTTPASPTAPASTTTPSASPPTEIPADVPDEAPADVVAFLDRLEAASLAEDTVRIRLDVPDAAGGGVLRGAIDRGAEPPRFNIETEGTADGDLQIRVVDDIGYVRGPDLAGPGTWVRADPADPDDPFGPTIAQSIADLDPANDFVAWRAGGRAVEDVGPEVVDDLDLVHHRLLVDVDAALAATGEPAPETAAPETITYDVWVDQASLMRRVAFTIGPITTISRLGDWGEDLDIRAPNPANVITSTEFVERSDG